jgi:hypothetical protein
MEDMVVLLVAKDMVVTDILTEAKTSIVIPMEILDLGNE